jgi:pSer/pThr/pTyr-binding forkhead associated (FHA) protein
MRPGNFDTPVMEALRFCRHYAITKKTVETNYETPLSPMYIVCLHNNAKFHKPIGPDNPSVVVGRLKECDIVVKDPKVSRRHCQFRWTDRGIEVRDKGSSSGTFVNGRQVGRARVSSDDDIQIGDAKISIAEYLDDAESSEPEPVAHEEAAASGDGKWEIHYDGEDGEDLVHTLSEIGQSAVIGRRSDADIRVINPTVGRHHCRLTMQSGFVHAQDLDSSNGTSVNNARISEANLKDGDLLECGIAPLRIRLIPNAAPADDGRDTWHDEILEDEMGPPNWFLIYKDDDDRICLLEMSLKQRVVAAGSDSACEIRAEDRGMEPEHIELTWEFGTMMVRDLGTSVGTILNGRDIDEVVLRNGDVITCANFQMVVVRGSSGEVLKARTGVRSAEADFWAATLTRRDEGLSFTYLQAIEGNRKRRQELTLWHDGEASIDTVNGDERTTIDGRVAIPIIDTLVDGLIRAGFPDVPADGIDDDEHPNELEVYLDSEIGAATFSRRVIERSSVYKEIDQILAAVLSRCLE